MSTRERLRIAVQKSGRLAAPSLDLLAQCGLSFRQSRDKLFCYGESLPIDLLLVRDDDIPGMLADGVCDLGIVGRNVLVERDRAGPATGAVRELRALRFGACRLALAIPQESSWRGAEDLRGLRIATSYPAVLGAWLAERSIEARIVVLNGSVEIAPRLGTADAICDLVSTGATLAANQLQEVETVLASEAVLAADPRDALDGRRELLELLLRRLDGVLAVKDSKLVMLHARRDALPRITRLLPGGVRPTVLPLDGDSDEVALQALCTGALTWQHLEDMQRAGAYALLVLPVEKMLS
jgi:ATP phosphoribosyltransferase